MAYILTVVFELHSGIIKAPTRFDREAVSGWASDKIVALVFCLAALVIASLLFGK